MKTPSLAKVRIIEITADSEGQRIDNFLLKRLKGVPKTRIYRALRTGEVRVNGSRKRAPYSLQLGDRVRIPPIRHSVSTSAANIPPDVLKHVPVLYEDDHLLVVNKPAGLAVHGGTGVSFGLIDAFRALRPESGYLELVHRLDRETSGCLMLAKNRPCLRALHEKLGQDRAVEKLYTALVKGIWNESRTVIRQPLRKHAGGNESARMMVDPAGQMAISVVQPMQHFADSTLVSIQLKTGRTHQARVHCASMGYPIAGDKLYGEDAFNQTMKKRGLGRLFLHAREIRLTHPMTGLCLIVKADLPGQMEQLLQSICE